MIKVKPIMIGLRFVFIIGIVVGVEIPLNIKKELSRVACLMECDNEAACLCDQMVVPKDWNISQNNVIELPTLFCREDDFFIIKQNGENLRYLLELKSVESDWKYIKLFDSNLTTIENLSPNSEYKTRIWGISNDIQLYGPTESDWIKTLPTANHPKSVPDIYLKELFLNVSSYTALIAWTPSTDLSCNYEFVWFGGDDISDYTQKEIHIPNEEFEVKIEGILFDSNYSVAVMAKSSDWSNESEKTWLHFITPNCLEIFDNLSNCVPETPTGLHCEESLSTDYSEEKLLYNIVASWNKPNIQPDYYTVNLMCFQLFNNSSGDFVNISGDSTSVIFENIDVGPHYQVTVEAWSDIGHSSPATFYHQMFEKNYAETNSSTKWDLNAKHIFFLLILPIGVIFIIGAIIFFIYYEINRRNRRGKRCRYFQDLEFKASQYLDSILIENGLHGTLTDEWEVDREALKLQSILGEGAFGIVRRGWLKRNLATIEVAVKMLKDSPKIDEIRQFQHEIEIMKSVGTHPNIVSMLGCCSRRNGSGPFLIVEYCSRGDLLRYLRSAWETITSNICRTSEIHYAELDFQTESPNEFSNMLYLMDIDRLNSEKLLIKDLISIARQISLGMEYLSNLRMLHRDLAARNVLICENGTVKVSDFGLSRDVYKDNIYCKTSSGKLPIRWMALESLTHQRYTTHSDVWSFGILLWEIVTLGGNPYPDISAKELVRLLKNGYRMDCPINCNDELYSLMLNCWRANPKERPSFREIRISLDNLIETNNEYLNLAVSVSYIENGLVMKNKIPKLNARSTPFERYVKPLSHLFP